jgi:hypothetical protein
MVIFYNIKREFTLHGLGDPEERRGVRGPKGLEEKLEQSSRDLAVSRAGIQNSHEKLRTHLKAENHDFQIALWVV